MPPSVPDIVNTHPLKVTDLVKKFAKKPYTIRHWAKHGHLPRAEKIGRAWCFPRDVAYVRASAAPAEAHMQRVQAALQLLNGYSIGVPRAA